MRKDGGRGPRPAARVCGEQKPAREIAVKKGAMIGKIGGSDEIEEFFTVIIV